MALGETRSWRRGAMGRTSRCRSRDKSDPEFREFRISRSPSLAAFLQILIGKRAPSSSADRAQVEIASCLWPSSTGQGAARVPKRSLGNVPYALRADPAACAGGGPAASWQEGPARRWPRAGGDPDEVDRAEEPVQPVVEDRSLVLCRDAREVRSRARERRRCERKTDEGPDTARSGGQRRWRTALASKLARPDQAWPKLGRTSTPGAAFRQREVRRAYFPRCTKKQLSCKSRPVVGRSGGQAIGRSELGGSRSSGRRVGWV